MNGKKPQDLVGWEERFVALLGEPESVRRDEQLARLMTEMERRFNIPILNDELYNWENPDIINLYRKISEARTTI